MRLPREVLGLGFGPQIRTPAAVPIVSFGMRRVVCVVCIVSAVSHVCVVSHRVVSFVCVIFTCVVSVDFPIFFPLVWFGLVSAAASQYLH